AGGAGGGRWGGAPGAGGGARGGRRGRGGGGGVGWGRRPGKRPPTRRYESANAFATDVRRYLNDEPVLACPPSAGYRLGKFVRRNRGLVLAASLVLLVLLGGIVGTTVGMARANRALRRGGRGGLFPPGAPAAPEAEGHPGG